MAIIAAAGRGTRFLPATKTTPKELLPLYDRPVIQHLVEEVAAAGIPEVVIVTRLGTAQALEAYFSRDADWDEYLAQSGKSHWLQPLYGLLDRIKISFALQPPGLPYGNGTPILATREMIQGPFLYMYGDDIIMERHAGDTVKSLVQRFQEEECAAVVAAIRVPKEKIPFLGSIAYDQRSPDAVEYIVEKPSLAEAPSVYTPIGRMVLSPQIISVLERHVGDVGYGKELWMTDAISALAQEATVLAPEISGRWLTTGDPASLLQASQEMQGSVESSGL